MSAVDFWLKKQLTEEQIEDYEHLDNVAIRRIARNLQTRNILQVENIGDLNREEIIEKIIESGHNFGDYSTRDYLRDEVADRLQNIRQNTEDFLRAINSITNQSVIEILGENVSNNPKQFIDNLFKVRNKLEPFQNLVDVRTIVDSLNRLIPTTRAVRRINVTEDWGPERLKTKEHILQYLDIWLTNFKEQLTNPAQTAQGVKIYGFNMAKVIDRFDGEIFIWAEDIYNGKWGERGADIKALLDEEVNYLTNVIKEKPRELEDRTTDLFIALRYVMRIYTGQTRQRHTKYTKPYAAIRRKTIDKRKSMRKLRDDYGLSNTQARNIVVSEITLLQLTGKIGKEEAKEDTDDEKVNEWLRKKEEVEGKIDKISEDYVSDNKPLYRKLQDILAGKTVVW
jgi:hypothetical protein